MGSNPATFSLPPQTVNFKGLLFDMDGEKALSNLVMMKLNYGVRYDYRFHRGGGKTLAYDRQ